ncbi:L-serine ammonia-lyase [Phycicoccus endophyticus]|uniref:L-serine dehydratase n=1 Tax=Phycicoccus endophyticus TaxID=1690220 RepID=A0A7G9QYW1_9MICO|nr:L-serine ammonia-lyase [Phycicoccus endophyticus]QNN48536.1 L-serine ammonia-lyase [Phycicoccus endophyticus]GGL31073.1 L-serine dehydratase [Phycicoccus endophyticus]
MAISAFDLFSVGIGPSSSHTVGPMRAAHLFVEGLRGDGLLERVGRVRGELFGSLGATGHGHGSLKAVLLGLEGEAPETTDPRAAEGRVDQVRSSGALRLAGLRDVRCDPDTDIVLHRRATLPFHSNGMRFTAWASAEPAEGEEPLRTREYYSVGGGFVLGEDEMGQDELVPDDTPVRYPFTTGEQLLARCAESGLPVSGVMLANETAWRTEAEVRSGLLHLWQVMQECVDAGCRTEGVLPGGLRVQRRAPRLAERLRSELGQDPLAAMDWVTLYALAVNEENASGGRIVTAPTNGAAGIVPAVLHYYTRFVPGADDEGVVRFLLTAAAIGTLYKENASISGAEVGCQGEVGSACSMAAGALAEVLGGTPRQVENAAEIGIEHNLGLTCDPVGGLVQIPCIERNAVGAVKAVTAARLAVRGDGSNVVSLDKAIRTMRDTGRDMKVKYKETARGGLAVNVIEC